MVYLSNISMNKLLKLKNKNISTIKTKNIDDDLTVKKIWFIQNKNARIEDHYSFKIDKNV